MKKILGIIGSARKSGNCELIIRNIHKYIKPKTNLNLLRLTDFEIKYCNGCYKCLFENKKCIIKDDLYKIIEAIIDSDAIILAAPTYFLSVHSSLKIFIDRTLALNPYIEKLWNKPSIGIGIAGIKGKEGSTLLGIENFLKFIFSDIKYVELIYSALPGEIFLNHNNDIKSKFLAKKIFNNSEKNKKPHCNLCGSSTFKFIDYNNNIKCMLCSNYGTINNIDSKNINIYMHRSEQQVFLTRKEIIKHKKMAYGNEIKIFINK